MTAFNRLLTRVFDDSPAAPAAPKTELGVAFLEDRVVLSGSPAGVAQVAGAVSSVMNKEVVAFDVTTKGRVSFNTSTGQYAAKIELPSGGVIDSNVLKSWMSGTFALPKVNPIQAAAAFSGMKTTVTSEYDAVRANLYRQHGGGNVYLASKQFTDWASAENVASTAAAAVVTSGSTTGQIIREAKEVIKGELGNLYTWLKVKAPQEAEATLAAAFKAMVAGQNMDSPHLEVKFVNVRQSYTLGLDGAAGMIADGLGVPASKTVTSSHKGFAVIWKGPGGSLDSLAQSLDQFVEGRMPGVDAFNTMLRKLADRPELKGLGKVADAVLNSDPSADLNKLVVDKLSAALTVGKAELRALYMSGQPILDLTRTVADEKLAAVLGKLAVGNEGTSKVTKLEFNLNTLEITAEVEVRHRHTWGSVQDILAAVGQKVGEWADKAGNKLKQVADWAGNTVRTTAYKGLNTVKETLSKKGDLLAKTVTNSAGYKTLEATWNQGVKTWEVTRDSAGRMMKEVSVVGSKVTTSLYTNGKRVSEVVMQGTVKLADRAWKDGVKTLDVVRDSANRLVSEYWKNGTDEFRNLFTNGVRTSFTKWAGGVNVAHYTYDAAGKFVTKYWTDGAKQISQWFTNGAISAENVVQNGVRIAEKAWANGVNTLNRVRDTGGRLVSEYWKNGTDEFRNLFTNGVRTSFTKWANGTTVAYNTYNALEQMVSQYWRDGAREFRNAYKNNVRVAQDVWENGTNVARHVWNSTGGYVGNALSRAGGAAAGVLRTVLGL